MTELVSDLERLTESCDRLVRVCADLSAGEQALVVSDGATRHLGERIAAAAAIVTDDVDHLTVDAFGMHGQEPPPHVAIAMSNGDVIFGITRMSMAHTAARRAASERGARYLSLADYSEDVMLRPAMFADFRAFTPLADRLAAWLTSGRKIRVETALGTNLTCSIAGRTANSAPGWCRAPGTLASPPDAEVNIAVIENASRGTVVVDGSIPCNEIGLLDDPVTLTIDNGSVVAIEGPRAETLTRVFDQPGNPRTRVIAEFGIGLNPLAELGNSMLEDEGCLGTFHLGIGSNATIGGVNDVPFHLDHITRNPTIWVDDAVIMKDGHLVV